MGLIGKILGILGILFLVFMGIIFFYTQELQQEVNILSTMNKASFDFYDSIKLRDYDTAYKNIETYEASCFEFQKEMGDFECYEKVSILYNITRKEQELEKQELRDMFQFHTNLLKDDILNMSSILEQMLEKKAGSVEHKSLQFQYKTANAEYSNHVDSFIKFLDENKEALIQEGLTAIEQQKWKNTHLDERSSNLVFINGFKE